MPSGCLYRCCKSKNEPRPSVILEIDEIARIRAGRFNGKPADLALSGGDHARFSRVSVSDGTNGYHEVLREILPLNDGLLCLPLSSLLWLSPPTSVTSFPGSSLLYSPLLDSRNILVDLLKLEEPGEKRHFYEPAFRRR